MKLVNRQIILRHELLVCYAEELKKIIIEQIVKELCYRCSVDYPSQIHHDVCIMMETKEQIRLCLDIALRKTRPFYQGLTRA